MPYFEENPLNKLRLKADGAEVELDLRGLPAAEAMAQVESLLEAADTQSNTSVLIRFDPAKGDGKETLFLPLGRRLLEARKAGLLASCLPTGEGDGYVVLLNNTETDPK